MAGAISISSKFAPHGEAALISRESEDVSELFSDVVEKVSRTSKEHFLTQEELNKYFPKELLTGMEKWLNDIENNNMLKNEHFPVAVCGLGSFFRKASVEILEENEKEYVNTAVKKFTDRSDIDIFFPTSTSLQRVDTSRIVAAQAGGGLLTALKYQQEIPDRVKDLGIEIDSSILRTKKGKFNTLAEFISANVLQAPNQPFVVFDKDVSGKIHARIIYQEESVQQQGFEEIFNYEINGTRAVVLLMQEIGESLKIEEDQLGDLIKVGRSQDINKILPELVSKIPKKLQDQEWGEVENAIDRHFPNAEEEGLVNRVNFYALIVRKSFKEFYETYDGDPDIAVKAFLQTGLLQTVLQSARITGNWGEYDTLGGAIELFTAGLSKGVEKGDPYFVKLQRSMKSTMDQFEGNNRAETLAEWYDEDQEGMVSNYDKYDRLAKVIENIPLDITSQSESGVVIIPSYRNDTVFNGLEEGNVSRPMRSGRKTL